MAALSVHTATIFPSSFHSLVTCNSLSRKFSAVWCSLFLKHSCVIPFPIWWWCSVEINVVSMRCSSAGYGSTCNDDAWAWAKNKRFKLLHLMCTIRGTKWPFMCWCAVKNLLTYLPTSSSTSPASCLVSALVSWSMLTLRCGSHCWRLDFAEHLAFTICSRLYRYLRWALTLAKRLMLKWAALWHLLAVWNMSPSSLSRQLRPAAHLGLWSVGVW